MGWEATDEKVTPSESGWTPQLMAPNPVMAGTTATAQTADDLVRAAANAASFGMADRLAGAMPGTSTAEQVKLSAEARKRSPYATIAGDVAGTAAIPSLGGGTVAARLGSGALARALGYGTEGAAIGAAQGAGQTYTGKPEDYAAAAGKGAAMGGVLGVAGGAAFAPRAPVSSAAVPTLDELGRATDIAYGALRANPTPYSASHLRGAADQLEQRLLNEGFVRDYSPAAFQAVDRMRASAGVPNAIATPADIELIRRGLNRIPKTPEAATDRAGAQIVKGALDDFLTNPPAGAVPPGAQAAAAQAGQTAQTARGLAAGEFRAQKMADIQEAATNAAAAANSGLNRENVIRQHVKNFINPNTGGRQRLAGYSPEEEAALESIVRRGPAANTARTVGNMLGGGGGIGTPVVALATGTAGGAAGQYFKDDPAAGAVVGGVLPFVGMGLRGASNRSAANTIRAADELIRQRNPLYEARAAVAPMVPGPSPLSGPTTKRLRDAITLELMKQTEGQ